MPGGPADRPWPILKDYPDAVDVIGGRWDAPIWAIGSLSDDGSIRSLSQWHHHEGMIAFTGSTAACKSDFYHGGEPIKTTVGAVLDYAFHHDCVLFFDQRKWIRLNCYRVFESEMYRIRNWGGERHSAESAHAIITNKMILAVEAYDKLSGWPR